MGFPFQEVAAPFFMVGSVLWIVSPLMCIYNVAGCLEVGAAAGTCFLVDCALLLASREASGRPVLLASYLFYGLASIGDAVVAVMDMYEDVVPGALAFCTGLLASMSFVLAGGLGIIYWLPEREWLCAASSGFFFVGAIVYAFTDSYEADVVAASFFMCGNACSSLAAC